MDIKKADSKGRVSGFTPGELYAFDREKGYFSPVIIKAPDGRPVEEALRRDMGTAEEAEMLLNQAMAKKNEGFGAIADLRDGIYLEGTPE